MQNLSPSEVHITHNRWLVERIVRCHLQQICSRFLVSVENSAARHKTSSLTLPRARPQARRGFDRHVGNNRTHDRRLRGRRGSSHSAMCTPTPPHPCTCSTCYIRSRSG